MTFHRGPLHTAASVDFRFTFVTVPRPQLIPDQIEMTKHVLTVWLSYPYSRVCMLSSASEYDPLNTIIPYVTDRFGSDRLIFVEALPTGYAGRPLVREWFISGMNHVKDGFVIFTNGDIIVPPRWIQMARRIFDTFKQSSLDQTLIFGIRTDVNRAPNIFKFNRKSLNFVTDLVRHLETNSRSDNPYGMDLVMVHSSFQALKWEQFPNFVVGMCIWDNFFMGWASAWANTVSMNFNVKIFNVDHPPNACNESNMEYFRDMSYASQFFSGLQDHKIARWMLDLEMGVLTSGPKQIKLRP
jgi:hypothetical protein